jgi:YD repeat-containing protein
MGRITRFAYDRLSRLIAVAKARGQVLSCNVESHAMS